MYSLDHKVPLKSFFFQIRDTCTTINLIKCGHTHIHVHIQHFQNDPTTMQCHGCQTDVSNSSDIHIHSSNANWSVWTDMNWHSHAIHKQTEKASRNAKMIIIHISFSHSQPRAFIGTEKMSVVGDKLWTRTHARITNTHTHSCTCCTCNWVVAIMLLYRMWTFMGSTCGYREAMIRPFVGLIWEHAFNFQTHT